MLEVEKKFHLSGTQEQRLLEGAEFLGEKIFTDQYFDNQEFSLGLSDMWLRKRDEEWNLKIPMREKKAEMINKYHEVEGEMAIREIFAIPVLGSFIDDLARFGHKPFCKFQTTRKKYQKEGFVIDIDEADYGDWKYAVTEIELLVAKEDEMRAAEEKIYAFAKRHDLVIEHINGKLVEFFKRKMPERYEALKKAKIVF